MEADKTEQPKEADKADDYKEMLQRVQADFENYKKRVEREIKDAKEISKAEVLRKFLPVLDSFEIAMKHLAENKDAVKQNEELRKGFELVYKQLKAAFDSENVRPITEKNFDPYQHEALMQEESDKPQGTILEEFQRGYKRGNQIIRHAKVKISRGKNEPSPAKDDLSNARESD
ncbi:MAG: nucleotide exchange factor GrpE [Nanoarchaeota archaeon]|nr:MAG: nucleotide exchange factor GrpE [Nanoarchaeota archaeon]